jgi:hypothetical protein
MSRRSGNTGVVGPDGVCEETPDRDYLSLAFYNLVVTPHLAAETCASFLHRAVL